MSEVGTPPPHNSDILHGPGDSNTHKHTHTPTGVPPRPNKYPLRTGKIITYTHIQQSSPSCMLHTVLKHGPRRIIEFTSWLLLVRIARVQISPHFEVDIFTVFFLRSS